MSRKSAEDTVEKLPDFLFASSDRRERARLERLKREGAIWRVGPRLYSSLPEERVPDALKAQWHLILAHLYPDAIVSNQTALTFRPDATGSIYLTSSYRKKIEYPGLTIHIHEGPGKDELDFAPMGIAVSSRARAFLENLEITKGAQKARNLPVEKLEERLEEILNQTNGEAKVNALRDEAKLVAGRLGGKHLELKRFEEILSAILGTGSAKKLVSTRAQARATGLPFDSGAIDRFVLLAQELSNQSPFETLPNFKSADHFKYKAFFESYFSNYIEGTEFEIDEAEAIVFDHQVPASRPQDAHDISATFDLVSDPTEMMITPKTPEDLEDLLKRRHKILFSARPSIRPGVFKEKTNRAGQTIFVDPDLVAGTLAKGFEIYQNVPEGIQRAIFMMFLISDVHPFNDGNGRLSRLMMNAELLNQELSTIIIPTVYREDYLLTLKNLTRQRRPEPFIRMLTKAQSFSHMDFSDYSMIKQTITDNFWFNEHREAKIRIPPR